MAMLSLRSKKGVTRVGLAVTKEVPKELHQ